MATIPDDADFSLGPNDLHLVRRRAVSKKKLKARDEQAELKNLGRSQGAGAMERVSRQLRTAAKIAAGVVLVVWLLAIGWTKGLDTPVPLYVATVVTLALGLGAWLIRRNLRRSMDLSSLVTAGGSESDPEVQAKIARLDKQVEKGDAAAIMAKAQLVLQDRPKDALLLLDKIDLAKAQKLVAAQARVMRAMIHLTLGDIADARALVDALDIKVAPDAPTRAQFASVQAEAWARSGNGIEANELLDKHDAEDPELKDVRLQLLRARVFACAHVQDMNRMRRALKQVIEISPRLAMMFVSTRRGHPLLEKEARKMLEKHGLIPKPKFVTNKR